MNIQAQSQKYGYLIAAGGTIIAFIGFLFLPYITITQTRPPSSSSSSTVALSTATLSAIEAAAIQGFIWLEILLAAVILLVALLLAFSRNPFGASQVALDKQVQWGLYAIIAVSLLSLLLEYWLMTTIPGQLVGSVSSNYPGFTSQANSAVNSVSLSYNVGSWFFLVGMLVAIGGAVYAMRTKLSTFSAQGQSSSPYMPPAPYPPQQPPYPSYQQDWQSQAQPPQGSWQPQPTQQAWQPPQPPTNYPPTQQAQQPYPPSQGQ